MRTRIRLRCAFAALSASCLFTSCSTTQRAAGPEAAEAPALDIRKGSPTEDLITALGEPQSIKPFEGDPENVSIWTYELKDSKTDMVAYDAKEVPYVDPITGELRMILEPDYKPETITNIQTIRVFVVDNQVIGWKVDREEERSIVR